MGCTARLNLASLSLSQPFLPSPHTILPVLQDDLWLRLESQLHHALCLLEFFRMTD
jgi:hypothetical protein